MICPYCNEKVVRENRPEHVYKHWYCAPCQCDILTTNDNVLVYTRFYFKYKNKDFIIYIDHKNKYCNLGENDSFGTLRLNWNYIPNFTPQNILKKIQTILTFS